MSRRFLPLLLLAPILAAADAPAGLPSLDQLANATPNVLLALGIMGLLTGHIVQGTFYNKEIARADAATAAAALSNKTAADAISVVARLTEEHRVERESFEKELAGLQRELGRLMPHGGRGGG